MEQRDFQRRKVFISGETGRVDFAAVTRMTGPIPVERLGRTLIQEHIFVSFQGTEFSPTRTFDRIGMTRMGRRCGWRGKLNRQPTPGQVADMKALRAQGDYPPSLRHLFTCETRCSRRRHI